MTHAIATFDATLRDLVEDGQPVAADCPYCDKPLSGETTGYGGGLMHSSCYAEFGRDMESAFPDELAPIHPQTFRTISEWDQTERIEAEEAEALYKLHLAGTPF